MTKDEMMSTFDKYAKVTQVPQREELRDWLCSIGLFDAPASTKYHGAHEGGLYDHCIHVYDALSDITYAYGLTWERQCSPFLIAMLHDICKCDQYEKTESGWQYKKNTLFTGHGEKSVMLLNMCPVRLTEEELVCIRYHMGAFTEKEQWGDYTNAIHKYPNVLWTHTADMVAAHIQNK